MKVIFTHYAREADDSAFQPLDKNPTPEKLDKMFAHYDADVIFFGHDHTPMSMRGKNYMLTSVRWGATQVPLRGELYLKFSATVLLNTTV